MRKIFISMFIFIAASFSLFSQYFPTDPISSWSVRKTATSGIYNSDSDNINASDIFDMKRSMFSLQYSPVSENRAGEVTYTTTNIRQTIQGYFGVAIKEQMYLGMAAAYDAGLSYTKNTSTGEKTKFNNPLVMLRPVFRINEKVALEYLFILNGLNTKDENKNYTNNCYEMHRLTAAFWAGNARLTIPLTLTKVNKDNKTTSGLSVIEKKDNYMRIDLTPELRYALESGPVDGVNLKINLNGNIVNKKNEMDAKAPSRFGGLLSFFPSLRWKMADGMVEFGTEPEVGVSVQWLDTGRSSTQNGSTTTNEIKPFMAIPFGTFVKAGEYVQVYAGFKYDIEYSMKNINNKNLSQKLSENALVSKMYAMTGFGVHIKEDVSIDFMIKILVYGTDSAASSTKTIFTLDNVGLQATYRF